MAEALHVDVVTPERQILAQAFDEVILPGMEGSFGVLPGHMPMVAVLKPGLMKLKAGGEEKLYALGGGYAEIMPDKVIVLADSAEPAEDIDLEKARQEHDRSLAQLKQGLRGPALDATEVSLQKALARIHVADMVRRRQKGSAAR